MQKSNSAYACVSAGGYKGFGLGMMVEVFCGMLAGSEYSRNIRTWRVTDRPANLVCVQSLRQSATHARAHTELIYRSRLHTVDSWKKNQRAWFLPLLILPSSVHLYTLQLTARPSLAFSRHVLNISGPLLNTLVCVVALRATVWWKNNEEYKTFTNSHAIAGNMTS